MLFISSRNINLFLYFRYSPNEGVLVLGATNRRQTLDKYIYIYIWVWEELVGAACMING